MIVTFFPSALKSILSFSSSTVQNSFAGLLPSSPKHQIRFFVAYMLPTIFFFRYTPFFSSTSHLFQLLSLISFFPPLLTNPYVSILLSNRPRSTVSSIPSIFFTRSPVSMWSALTKKPLMEELRRRTSPFPKQSILEEFMSNSTFTPPS